jgi:hypothetical protein
MEEQEAPSIKSSNEPSYIEVRFKLFAVVELAAFVFDSLLVRHPLHFDMT